MSKKEIVRYFRNLQKIFRHPCLIIMTGASAGALYGRVRATLDIDFAVRFKTKSSAKKEKCWQEFARATGELARREGIGVQYAEDIDRWSQITYLDYDKHTLPFRHFGKMEVRILQPSYWAIGKLTRYLEPDIQDLIEVLRKSRTSVHALARLCGRALRQSPKSTACELFRRQVEDFFTSYGRKIWGKNYSTQTAIRVFREQAKIR